MSIEENKALNQRFSAGLFGKGNLAIIDELLAPDFVLHASPPGIAPTREGYKQWIEMVLKAFPDIEMKEEDCIAEGDKVVIRVINSYTHQGEYMGIPATGKRVTISAIIIMRMQDGKITDMWHEMDTLGLMRQIGAIPQPGRAEK